MTSETSAAVIKEDGDLFRWLPFRPDLLMLGVALLLILVVAVLSYSNWLAFNRANEQLKISQVMTRGTDDLLSTLVDAETGQRGYLLVGRDPYLEPYRQAVSRVPSILSDLSSAAMTRPDQARRLESLRPLIQQKLAKLQETIDLRQSKGLDDASVVVAIEQGKATMDEIRKVLAEIEKVADARRDAQYDDLAGRGNRIGVVGSLGGGILFIFLLASTLTIHRGTRAREKLTEQVRQSRDWLQTTLASIGDGVIATDEKGRITFLNGVSQSLTGWSQQEAAGVPLDQVFVISNEETGAPMESPVSKALREGRIVGLANHTKLTAKNGGEVPIDDSAAPIRDKDGNIIGVVLVFRDISERKEAEDAREKFTEQLRQSRDWLQTTLTSIGDGVIATDENGHVAFLNGVSQALTGWSQEEAAGVPLDQVFVISNEETGAPVENPVSKALREGRIVGLANHTKLTAKDGSEVPIDDSAAPIRDNDGNIIGVVLVFRDISERKETEKVMAHLAAIVKFSDDAIIGKDLNGTILSWNEGAERMFGYSAQEAIGKPIAIIAGPHDEMPKILDRIRQGESIDHYDTIRRTKSGGLLDVSVSVSPLRDSEGHIIGASKIVRDITERKHAEERLRRSERETREARDWLRTTLSSIGDAVIATDANGRVTLLNDVAVSLTGWREEDAIGCHLDEIFVINNESGATVESPVDKALREKTIVGLENHTRLTRKDGRQIPIDDSAAPIRDAHGKVIGVVMVFRDVTERRRVETELRRANQLLQPVACFVRDRQDDSIIHWNPGAADLYGFSAAEATGKICHSLLKTQFPTPLDKIQSQVMREGAWQGELLHTRRDGQRITVESHWTLHKDADGHPSAILEVNLDVTERKRLEEELRRSEERLASMIHHLPIGIAVVNKAGHVLMANPMWSKFLRGNIPAVDDEEAKRWQGFYPDGRLLERERYPVIRALGGEYVMPGVEFLHTSEDGFETWTRLSAVPFHDPNGDILGALAVVQDISDLKQASENLRMANESLLRANEDLRQFAFAASHDLQEPLRMITSYSQLLVSGYKGKLEDDAELCLRFITEGTKRMRSLLSDLLAYTQVAETQETAQSVPLNAALEQALENCKAAIEETDALIDGADLPEVSGYEPHFVQLFQNLIGNAIKYRSNEPPRIAISTEQRGNNWLFGVKDNGIGIAPEYHKQIFGVFKRLHGKQIPGTGIGLAICQRVVERHGGKIWVDSQPEQGSTFYFTLPVAGGGEG